MSVLYRHFDSGGKLLYVGISISALQRFLGHRSNSEWVGQIATMTIEQCANIDEARERERAAIKAEKPLWNIQHNKRGQSAWIEFLDHMEASGRLHEVGSEGHIDCFNKRIADLEEGYKTPGSMLFQNEQIQKSIKCLSAARDHYQMGGQMGAGA